MFITGMSHYSTSHQSEIQQATLYCNLCTLIYLLNDPDNLTFDQISQLLMQ
jgi:hypothetical protein